MKSIRLNSATLDFLAHEGGTHVLEIDRLSLRLLRHGVNVSEPTLEWIVLKYRCGAGRLIGKFDDGARLNHGVDTG